MRRELTLESGSSVRTKDIGRRLGELIWKGGYICLYGELGAGKTTFVQGLAEGLGVLDPYVTSPSFALVNEYSGRLALYHIDLYRLSSPADLDDTGFSEYPGDGVAAVEWPERAAGLLPEHRLDITIEASGGDARKITFRAAGELYMRLLEDLCRSFR